MVNEDAVDAFLSHHGVKGQKWGVRNNRAPGASRSVNRHAKKDASEFARAKAFFGEGAGTRRKLINQTISSKSKNMPGYKEALDFHLGKQDQAKHVSKAVSERTRIDRTGRNKKRIGALARRITGEPGTQAAFVAAAASGAAYLNSSHGREHLKKAAKKVSSVAYKVKQQKGAAHINKLLKNMGGA